MLIKKEWQQPQPINSSVAFPLNMRDQQNRQSVDFVSAIKSAFNIFSNASENEAKYGFIWVEAHKYCGAEYALHKCLYCEMTGIHLKKYYFLVNQEANDELADLDLEEKIGVCDKLTDIVAIRDSSDDYITRGNDAKIFIFDHAENITEPQELIDFSKTLYESGVNNAIFIFLDKRPSFENSFWKNVSAICNGGLPFIMALRRGKHFKIAPFTDDQLKEIFNNIESLGSDKKQGLLQRVSQFDDHLRRAYFLDRFIAYILDEKNSIPHDFKSFNLLLAIYENILLEIYIDKSSSDSHTPLENNPNQIFEDYIAACNNRITSINDNPIKQFVWAYGIAQLINENRCDNMEILFKRVFIEFQIGVYVQGVFEEIFEFVYPEGNALDFLLKLINYSKWGAVFSLRIIHKYWAKIEEKGLDIQSIFLRACELYSSDIQMCPNSAKCEKGEEAGSCQGEIKSRFALGMAIGVLLPNVDETIVKEGLNHIFKDIEQDYVLPQVDNYSGISVCPITNFEYKKFVDAGGYDTFKMPDVGEVREVYYQLYEKLIGILAEAAKTDNQRLRRRVAKALRGSTWPHYNLLSYILKEMRLQDDSGKIIALKKVLEEYYGEIISAPVKWKTPYDVTENFCNPLQPVVGISLFEAEAYAKWLSKKSGKKVRLVKYNPDYLKVVGVNSSNPTLKDLSATREKFNTYKSQTLLKLINIRENTKCYYGPNNTGDQGPAPVGLLPNFKCSDSILDFLGNTYEMQSTEYTFAGEGVRQTDIPAWQRVYNCSGGGWQHASDHLPTDYMGQFTALTRNQDIGFRIVVINDDKEDVEYEYDNLGEEKFLIEETRGITFQETHYTEYNVHATFNGPLDLKRFGLKFHIDCNRLLKASETLHSNSNPQTSIKFFSKQDFNTLPQEAIMLYANGFDIFAYYLQKSTCVNLNDKELDDINISVISRAPILPQNPNDRKNWSNRELADKIEMMEICWGQQKAFYSAKAIDIACGRLIIDNVKKNPLELHELLGIWDIVCDSDYESELIDGTIKSKINAKFLMPDWIDLFEIINLNNDEPEDIVDKIDTDTTMTVLSTIDTADLHKLIDTRIK